MLPTHRYAVRLARLRILLKCAPWLSLSVSMGMKSHVDQPKFVVSVGAKMPDTVDSDVSRALMGSPFTDISMPPRFTVVVVWDIDEATEWPSVGLVVDLGSKRCTISFVSVQYESAEVSKPMVFICSRVNLVRTSSHSVFQLSIASFKGSRTLEGAKSVDGEDRRSGFAKV